LKKQHFSTLKKKFKEAIAKLSSSLPI